MATINPNFANIFKTNWKICGEQTQEIWDEFLDTIGDDPAIIWVNGSIIVMLLIYWGYATIFIIIDGTKRPRWIFEYKIQREQNEALDKDKYWKAIKQVIFNQLIVTPLFIYISHLVMFKFSTPSPIRQLPSMKIFLFHLMLMCCFEEPLFYYAHRLLHHPPIFKYIHKKHHEWNVPIAATLFYCHSLEHILRNIGPIAVSVAILNPHVIIIWTFIVIAIVYSMTDHAGFYFLFPLSKNTALFHNYHRSKFNYNFGVFGTFDKLHLTYKIPN